MLGTAVDVPPARLSSVHLLTVELSLPYQRVLSNRPLRPSVRADRRSRLDDRGLNRFNTSKVRRAGAPDWVAPLGDVAVEARLSGTARDEESTQCRQMNH